MVLPASVGWKASQNRWSFLLGHGVWKGKHVIWPLFLPIPQHPAFVTLNPAPPNNWILRDTIIMRKQTGKKERVEWYQKMKGCLWYLGKSHKSQCRWISHQAGLYWVDPQALSAGCWTTDSQSCTFGYRFSHQGYSPVHLDCTQFGQLQIAQTSLPHCCTLSKHNNLYKNAIKVSHWLKESDV